MNSQKGTSMRIKTALGILVATMFVVPAFAESPFVGKWTATAAAPTGPASETLTVAKTSNGYAIDAKLTQPTPGQPEAGPGKDIVLEGDHFWYKRTLSIAGNEIVINYTGVVSGDTFTGTVDIAGAVKLPYTGVRIKERK
jgi:hypothetical protein